MDTIADAILASVIAAAVGLVVFLIKNYFDGIREDIADGRKDFAKVEGHLASLQAEIRANTVELARVTTELKAVWRYIDAPRRASDHENGERR